MNQNQSTQPTNQDQQKIPSKDELKKYFSDKTEVLQVQLKMQRHSTEIAELRAREVKAYAEIAMITHQPKDTEDAGLPGGPQRHIHPTGKMPEQIPEDELKHAT